MIRILCAALLFTSFLGFSQYAYQGDPYYDPPLLLNMKSPNASDLGKYGDIPVTLYNGTPDISVPIYHLEENGIPLDITLRYDASGVRVNSVPGWVGQNWSLNCGGVIVRTVKGNAVDEFDIFRGRTAQQINHMLYGDSGGQWVTNDLNFPMYTFLGLALEWPECRLSLNKGFMFKLSELNTLDWASTNHLLSVQLKSQQGYFPPNAPGTLETVVNYQPDLEPDIFTFNFMGHSGKFFMGQDGQWKVSSSSNLKVVSNFPQDLLTPVTIPAPEIPTMINYIPSVFPRIINTFTLLDDQGNRFVFGGGNCVEYTFPEFFKQRSTPIISSAFYLQSVYDKFGNQVYKFDYDKGPYIGQFYLDWSRKFYEQVSNPSPEFNNPNASADWIGDCDFTTIKGSGQLILPVYLKKITAKSGKTIDFTASVSNAMKFSQNDNPLFQQNSSYHNIFVPWENEWDFFLRRLPDLTTLNPNYEGPLNTLKWKKLDNITITDPSGSHSLAVNFDYTNIPSRRLFLKGVSIADKEYGFEYYHDDLLPNFMSSAIDHLGYFNNHRFTFTCSPLAVQFWRNYGSQRYCSADYMQYGSLKKIIYPTKGYTQFEFEPHNYSKEIDKFGNLISSPVQGMMSGLRIWRLINNDGNGNNYIKEYQYTNGINSSVSSGNLLFKPTYFVENIMFPNYNYFYPYCSPYTFKMREINITPMIPLSNLMGNTVEYGTVIEKYGYYNQSHTVSNGKGYTIYKYSNYEQFPDLPPLNSLVPDYNFRQPRTDRGFERGSLMEKSVYDVYNILKKRTTYQYASNGDLKVNAMKMSAFGLGEPSSGQTYFSIILSAYQIYYADKYKIQENEETFNDSGIATNLKIFSYKGYPDAPGTITNFGDLFPNTTYQEVPSGGEVTTFRYPFDFPDAVSQAMVNTRNLPSVYEKKEFFTGTPQSPMVGTLLSEKKTDYVTMQNGYGDDVQVMESIKGKKANYPYEERFKASSYHYDGSLLEFSSENGAPVSIIWGYNHTKPVAKLENIKYSDIDPNLITSIQAASNTGTEDDLLASLESLRNTYPEAMISTYTYDLLAGLHTETDARGRRKTYEYDSSGRLRIVRDHDGSILSKNTYHYKQ